MPSLIFDIPLGVIRSSGYLGFPAVTFILNMMSVVYWEKAGIVERLATVVFDVLPFPVLSVLV